MDSMEATDSMESMTSISQRPCPVVPVSEHTPGGAAELLWARSVIVSNAHLMDPSTGGGRNATTTTYLRSVRPRLFRGGQTARTTARPGVSSVPRLLEGERS